MTITPDLIKTAIIAIPVTFISIMILRMLQQGKISNIRAGKDGIAIDMNSLDKRMESKHYLDRVIHEIDSMNEYWLYKYTVEAGRYLQKIINRASTVCTPTLYMVSAELRNILYQALRENDFKNKLKKENRKSYIDEKLNDMETAYLDILIEHERKECTIVSKEIKLPAFDTIKNKIEAEVEDWTNNIRKTLIDSCTKKIDAYNHYLQVFIDAKDEYFIYVVKNCIAKNQKYIESLSD